MAEITLDDVYCFSRLPQNPKDYWDINLELSYIEPFASFVDVEDSAKVMSAIHMLYDPKSIAQNSTVPIEQMKKDISKNVIGDEKFPWKDYGKYIRAFKKYCKTPVEQELSKWFQEMAERTQYMKEFSWEEDPELKEKMLLKNDEHFEKYNRIRATLKEERTEVLMHGNYTPSRLERRVL